MLWTDPLHCVWPAEVSPPPEEPCESTKVTAVLRPVETPYEGHEAQRRSGPRSGRCLPPGPARVTETQSPFLQQKRVPCLCWGCPGDSSVSARARDTRSLCPRRKRHLHMLSTALPGPPPAPDGGLTLCVTGEPARPVSRKPRTLRPSGRASDPERPLSRDVSAASCLVLTPPQPPGARPCSRNPCGRGTRAGDARTVSGRGAVTGRGLLAGESGRRWHRFTSEWNCLPLLPLLPGARVADSHPPGDAATWRYRAGRGPELGLRTDPSPLSMNDFEQVT